MVKVSSSTLTVDEDGIGNSVLTYLAALAPSLRNAGEMPKKLRQTSPLTGGTTSLIQAEDHLQLTNDLTRGENSVSTTMSVILVGTEKLDKWCTGTNTHLLTTKSSGLNTAPNTSTVACEACVGE